MGVAGGSTAQKKFKQQEHKRERRAANQALDKESLASPKKFGNEWDSPRDGKMWFGNCKTKWPLDYLKWLRK